MDIDLSLFTQKIVFVLSSVPEFVSYIHNYLIDTQFFYQLVMWKSRSSVGGWVIIIVVCVCGYGGGVCVVSEVFV